MPQVIQPIPIPGDSREITGIPPIPGVCIDGTGKPIIDLAPESLYAFGHLIRLTEELILELFSKGLLSGTTHTCIGQELCQMAVVRALDGATDAVLSNHRNHGHFLTYSGQFSGLVAEIMGRAGAVCAGRGGSQHLAYRQFHSNGVQGGMTGIGVGLAMQRKRAGGSGIVVAIVGDGTLGEGLLYESMNLATIWQLPILFVIENNRIAQTTRTEKTIGGRILDRGAAFGLATWQLDDTHPDLFEQVQGVVDTIREHCRPGFLVIDTQRMGPHSKGDDLRADSEMSAIRLRDPLRALGERLSDDVRASVERRNREFVESVSNCVMNAPELRSAGVPTDIFVRDETAVHRLRLQEPSSETNVRAALNSAMRQLLEISDECIVLGEDLHDPYGGAFKVTAGLSTDFPGRVLSTPISEAGIVGCGIGLAMAGYRPIVEIMFADFLTLAMDQIYNHAVKFPGMFPDANVPLVIRAPCGGRRGYGPTHSQSPENIFAAVPGLTIVYGSHRHNVGQLLVDAATLWSYPTLFLEHKLLYGEIQGSGDFEPLELNPQDKAVGLFPILRRARAFPDVTIVTYGGMLPIVERAAEYLENEEELAVEIIVPSLLAPLPAATLVGALKERERIVIVEESQVTFGVSAELFACLFEAGARGRGRRVGTPCVPIPAARSLECEVIPGEQQIVDSVLSLF